MTDSPAVTDVAQAYRAAAAALGDLLRRVPADGWERPSPCDGWTARDVVRHVVDTERDIVTRVGLALPPGRPVDEDPAGAFEDLAAGLQAVLDAPELAAREYDGYFGRTSLAATVNLYYIFDLLAHRWDVATAVGLPAALTEAELDTLEAGLASLGDSIYLNGVCRRIDVPTDADRMTRVLARLGRVAS